MGTSKAKGKGGRVFQAEEIPSSRRGAKAGVASAGGPWARGGDHLPGRFCSHLADYFDATLAELRARRAGECPDTGSYIRLRQQSGGVFTAFALVEMIEDAHLSRAVREHSSMRQIAEAANNVIAWSNDLLSLDNDLRDAGHISLVIALQHEHGRSLQESVDTAAGMHDAEVRRFLTLERELPHFGRHSGAVFRYLRGLRWWMRANLDWSIATGRYRASARNASGLPALTPS
jgi:hypothetical protein